MSPPHATLLGIFAKHPVPGRVKTRLAASIGSAAAADLYRAFLTDLLFRFASVADRRCLAIAGDEPEESEHRIPDAPEWEHWSQPEGDLGVRMAQFFTWAFRSGAERVVLIGSDAPDLPHSLIDDAFAGLNESDVVIAPAPDGGYCLVGQSRPEGEPPASRDLFTGVEWSSAEVLTQTRQTPGFRSASVVELEPWPDVDDLADLEALRERLRRLAPESPDCPQRTRELVLK